MLHRMSGEEKARLEAEFLEKARVAWRRMFDPRDETVQRTFTEIEDRACDGGDELSRFMMVSRVGGEVSSGPVETCPCPECGRPTLALEDETAAERELVTRRGALRLARPERACPACRRALFPPRP